MEISNPTRTNPNESFMQSFPDDEFDESIFENVSLIT
jgi:hypothetical protein